MIGVGSPFILGVAVFGAVLTCVLHFLSVRRPPVLMLPTMRFLPERPVRAVSRNARPSDLLLLLLRVAALLLAGVALSGVTWRGTGVKHGRILVVQRNSAVNGPTIRAQVARALSGGFSGDTAMRIVVVDSAAHFLTAVESKAFRAGTLSVVRGAVSSPATLSATILVATRAAGELVREERTVDAVDLVIAGPLLQSSRDAALPTVRATWPGTIRFFDTQHSPDIVDSSEIIPYPRRVTLVGALSSDAVRSAFQVRGWLSGPGNRDAKDSVTAAAANLNLPNVSHAPIAVEWPATGTPEGWTVGAPVTVGAIVARGEALVFPFVRTSRISESIQAQGRAIAWWSDGETAAVEIPTATSCTRHVGVNVPNSSDLLQGQAARALLLALSGPCGGELDRSPIPAAELRMLEGTGGGAPASAFRSTTAIRTPWASLILVLALALLGVEWFVRDREDRLDIATERAADSVRKVA
ncbi:MAG: hypothetical protein ABI852_12755 [Gemmatimonadaceae bacterium]